MSLRPAPWPIFGTGVAKKSGQPAGARRPELKLIEGSGSRRLERFSPRVRFVAALMSVGVVLFAVVAFHVSLSQGQFKLEALQGQVKDQQDQYSRLRLQVAELESPARITSEAQARLGMVPPDNVTAVAPQAGDMPDAPVSGVGPASPGATDLGAWSDVKPHLSAAAK